MVPGPFGVEGQKSDAEESLYTRLPCDPNWQNTCERRIGRQCPECRTSRESSWRYALATRRSIRLWPMRACRGARRFAGFGICDNALGVVPAAWKVSRREPSRRRDRSFSLVRYRSCQRMPETRSAWMSKPASMTFRKTLGSCGSGSRRERNALPASMIHVNHVCR